MPEAAAPAEENPEVARLKKEGLVLLKAGRPEEARVRYSEALRLSPKDLEAREGIASCAVLQGNAALDRGEVDAAIAHFQMALELVPFHPAADAGLRRADALSRERASKADPIAAAIDALPPVKAFREARTAERVLARVTGTPRASEMVRQRLEAREAQGAAATEMTRAERLAREELAAWRRRWFFRSLPAAAMAVSAALAAALSAPALAWWGIVLAIFAALWDLVFVERGHRHERAPPEA